LSVPPYELQNPITRFNYTNYRVVLPTFVLNSLSFEKTEDKKFSTHTCFKASTVSVVGSTVLWNITLFKELKLTPVFRRNLLPLFSGRFQSPPQPNSS